MKNLTLHFYIVSLAMLAFIFASCDNDNREDELQAGLDGLEKRIEVLETMQDQITAIQQLLEAADRNHITSVEDVTDAAGRTGFKISFKDSDPITIYNGVNGTNGVNAPTISVKKHDDGKFYWTLNDEFIEIEGAKILAEGSKGDNGVTPKLKIENNTWKVSYDGGNKWSTVEGAATGGAGTGSNVSYEDKGLYYEFTINGSSINIPKYVPLAIKFFYNGNEGSSFEVESAAGSDTYEITYGIEGLYTGQIPVVEVIGKNGYTASVNVAAKKITITAPDVWSAGSVLIFVSDGDQRTIMRTVGFRQSGTGGTIIAVTDDSDNQILEAEATSVTLSYNTDIKDENLVVTIGYTGESQGWLTQNTTNVITKAELVAKTLTFIMEPNTSTEARTATVTISDNVNTNLKQTFTVTQKGAAPSIYEISVDKPLATQLGETLNTVSSLTLTGVLAEADWATLKAMATNGALTNLDLSALTNKEIPAEAFRGAKKLIVIKFPSALVTIGEKAFYESVLVDISLPATLKTIGKYAFYGSLSLSKIIMPESFTVEEGLTIDNYAFEKCTSLTAENDEFIIPAGVTKIGVVAFRGCVGLNNKMLVISDKTYLDDRAFVLTGDTEPISFSKVVCKFKGVVSIGTDVFGTGSTKLPVLQVPVDWTDDYQRHSKWNVKFSTIEAIQE